MITTKNTTIPPDEWKARRAEKYEEARKELAKKLRESYKIANTMWLLADDRYNNAITRSILDVIRGLESLLIR